MEERQEGQYRLLLRKCMNRRAKRLLENKINPNVCFVDIKNAQLDINVKELSTHRQK